MYILFLIIFSIMSRAVFCFVLFHFVLFEAGLMTLDEQPFHSKASIVPSANWTPHLLCPLHLQWAFQGSSRHQWE